MHTYAQYIGYTVQKVEKILLAQVDKFPDNTSYTKAGNLIHYIYLNDAKDTALDQTIYFDKKVKCVVEMWKYCCAECYASAVNSFISRKLGKFRPLNDSLFLGDWPYDVALRTHDTALYFTLEDIVVGRKEFKAMSSVTTKIVEGKLNEY